MTEKVFISGSIKLKSLPKKIHASLDKMIQNKLSILIGDASGIDSLVQSYFANANYTNLCIYTIYDTPRNQKSSLFKTKTVYLKDEDKKEREKQTQKDSRMSKDSDYSLVIWDGSSRGSYQNIIRAIEQQKGIRVFYTQIEDFIPKEKLNENEIRAIFEENNGYSAKEILELLELQNLGNFFKNDTKKFYQFLIEKKLIEKHERNYKAKDSTSDYFKEKKYQGMITGILFTNKFFSWLEDELRKEPSYEQGELL